MLTAHMYELPPRQHMFNIPLDFTGEYLPPINKPLDLIPLPLRRKRLIPMHVMRIVIRALCAIGMRVRMRWARRGAGFHLRLDIADRLLDFVEKERHDCDLCEFVVIS